MKKQFFAAAMILALGAGFTACSSDDLNVKSASEKTEQTLANSTYMSFVLNVADLNNTRDSRASNWSETSDNQASTSPSYNHVGQWKGIDEVSAVNYYIFDGVSGGAKLEAQGTLDATNWDVDKTGNELKIKPKKGIQVTPGRKTVFVVVNPNTEVANLLPTTLSSTTLAAFQVKYESSDLTFAAGTATKTCAEQVASFTAATTTPAADAKDNILMTGYPANGTIASGVTEDQTVPTTAGTAAQNRISLSVQRVAARVLVTSKAATYELKGYDPTQATHPEITVATINKLEFSEAQGGNKVYFVQKTATDEGTSFTTPGYDFVPTNDAAFNGTVAAGASTGADKYFDYSGLQKSHNVPTYAAGLLTNATFEKIPTLHGAFVLPNTHKWSEDLTTSGYKKGNTAYVLIRAFATPKYVATDSNDGTKTLTWTENWFTNTKYTTNPTIVLGDDGYFYENEALAQKAAKYRHDNEPTKYTATTQNVTTYVVTADGIKMLYWAWLNPNTTTTASWASSPVIRNNVYHISIADISRMGQPWNNLVPKRDNDPKNPTNPDSQPTPGTHENPNPNPGGGPGEPLGTPKTYMSVDATILPWQVHSYEISF